MQGFPLEASGAISGAGIGGFATGLEWIYDEFIDPLLNEIRYQIWNFENQFGNAFLAY